MPSYPGRVGGISVSVTLYSASPRVRPAFWIQVVSGSGRTEFVQRRPDPLFGCSRRSTAELAHALNDFEHHYNQVAQPFQWNFTRRNLAELLDRLDQQPTQDPPLALAA